MSTLDISRKVLGDLAGLNPQGVAVLQEMFLPTKVASGMAARLLHVRHAVVQKLVACSHIPFPANCQAPVSKGQMDEGSSSTDLPTVTVSLGGSNWTYGFRFSSYW